MAEEVVGRINKYLNTNQFPCEVNKEHIQLITLQGHIALCAVKCIFCPSEVSCKFNKGWNICNYTSHIRKHLQALVPAQSEQAIETPGPSLGPSSGEIRGNNSVLAEVDSILR